MTPQTRLVGPQTCWDWDEPSRRSTEADGGTHDGTVEGTMRFWIHGQLR